jgi:hypothetical protein
VDTEGSPALGDRDQTRDERGQFLGQGGELVHHDHQPGQWDGVGQCRDVGDPVGAQDRLTPSELRRE